MKMTTLASLGLAGFYGLGYMASADAEGQIAQTLSISTHFKSIVDKPSWLLELRDIESGQVLPYLFDIRNNDNFFLAFSKERTYRVTASILKFGPYAVIKNFCGLEDGILTGKSMFITLTGVLSPDPKMTHCRVSKFNQMQFTVVTPEVSPEANLFVPLDSTIAGSTSAEEKAAKAAAAAKTENKTAPAAAKKAAAEHVIENRGLTPTAGS